MAALPIGILVICVALVLCFIEPGLPFIKRRRIAKLHNKIASAEQRWEACKIQLNECKGNLGLEHAKSYLKSSEIEKLLRKAKAELANRNCINCSNVLFTINSAMNDAIYCLQTGLALQLLDASKNTRFKKKWQRLQETEHAIAICGVDAEKIADGELILSFLEQAKSYLRTAERELFRGNLIGGSEWISRAQKELKQASRVNANLNKKLEPVFIM